MKSIRIVGKLSGTGLETLVLTEMAVPKIGPGQCLIEVHASGINPSDAKALQGAMPNLVWPRTPGRDYAGIVAEGPSSLIGKEVWGTGGDLGMSRDGAHSEYVVTEAAGVREKPRNISLLEAGGLGVSFTCAYLGLVDGARVKAGETVAVLGANGRTGEAAVQLASAAGARVIAVERRRGDYGGFAKGAVEVLDLRQAELETGLRELTGGRGADVIFNSAGSPYFEAAGKALAKKGRHIIISTFDNEVAIDLRVFYRGNHRLIGISNMDSDSIVLGAVLAAMTAAFEAGDLRPFAVNPNNVYGLDDAKQAYRVMLEGSLRERIYLTPRT